jgi:hypothetical protein
MIRIFLLRKVKIALQISLSFSAIKSFLGSPIVRASISTLLTSFHNIFAIDFDEKSLRVARTLNLIAGDGQTNVLHLNSLDWERWDQFTEDEDWQDTYFDGWRKMKKLRKNKKSNHDFQFDILMANPPFAGDIKESRILAKYDFGKKPNGKYQTKVGRDILFIERNIDFLKPDGRMAIVLPQGKFKVKPKQAEPVQGEIELQEGMEHYVATPKELDEYVLDGHDHLIVKHDLYNSDGMPR